MKFYKAERSVDFFGYGTVLYNVQSTVDFPRRLQGCG